jgi:hypothetical protein
MPFIVASSVLMLGLFAPINSRSANWIKQSAIPSFVTLIVWGALMAVDKIMSASIFGLWSVIVAIIFAICARVVWQKN